MTTKAEARHCTLGYCRGSLAGRGRSRYCCDEHAAAARTTQTVEARKVQVVEDLYERIGRGEAEPIAHLGWLRTTNGLVLDGDIVRELLGFVEGHRAAMGELVAMVRRPGATMQQVGAQVDTRVIAVDRQLLALLRQVLTEQRPPRRP